MKTFTTITGKEIKVIANTNELSFIIITTGGEWITNELTEEEYDSMLNYYTGNDWMRFINNTDEYSPLPHTAQFSIINNDWSYSYNEGEFVSNKTTPELYTLQEAIRIMEAHEGEEDFRYAKIILQ